MNCPWKPTTSQELSSMYRKIWLIKRTFFINFSAAAGPLLLPNIYNNFRASIEPQTHTNDGLVNGANLTYSHLYLPNFNEIHIPMLSMNSTIHFQSLICQNMEVISPSPPTLHNTSCPPGMGVCWWVLCNTELPTPTCVWRRCAHYEFLMLIPDPHPANRVCNLELKWEIPILLQYQNLIWFCSKRKLFSVSKMY